MGGGSCNAQNCSVPTGGADTQVSIFTSVLLSVREPTSLAFTV